MVRIRVPSSGANSSSFLPSATTTACGKAVTAASSEIVCSQEAVSEYSGSTFTGSPTDISSTSV